MRHAFSVPRRLFGPWALIGVCGLLAVGATGCPDRTVPENGCTTNGECAAGEVCASGTCVERPGRTPDPTPEAEPGPETDGGEPEPAVTPPDAGPDVDAGPADAGVDAGPSDAGPSDAGIDAGPPPVTLVLQSNTDVPAIGLSAVVLAEMNPGTPFLSRPDASCQAPIETDRAMQIHSIRNPTASPVVVTVRANFATDGFLHLYRPPFDPALPLNNCLAGNDDGLSGINASEILRFTLQGQESVVAVVTAYAANTLLGPYSLEVTQHGPSPTAPDFVDVTTASQQNHSTYMLHSSDPTFVFPDKDCGVASASLPYQTIFFRNPTANNYNFDATVAFAGGVATARVYFRAVSANTVETPIDDFLCAAPTSFATDANGDVAFADYILAGEAVLITLSSAAPAGAGLMNFDIQFSPRP